MNCHAYIDMFLILALLISKVLSIPMMTGPHRPIRQRQSANNDHNRFIFDSMPPKCRNNIISKIGDPHDIANLMATCSQARDIIAAIDDPLVVRRTDPEEYARRNQPYRISENLATFLVEDQRQLTAIDDLRISSNGGVPLFMITANNIDRVKNSPAEGKGEDSVYTFIHVIDRQKNIFLMVFGTDMARSFLMYSALRKYQVSWISQEPVLIENSVRDPNPGGLSGFIFNSGYRVFHLLIKPDSGQYFSVQKMLKSLHDILCVLPTLDHINVRYQRNIFVHSNLRLVAKKLENNEISGAHVFLDPSYIKAYDPYLPNENVMIIVALFARTMNNVLVSFPKHKKIADTVKFICKFRLARPYVRLISDSGNHFYHCSDNDQLYSDTVTFSEIREELKELLS